jgi:hypothetical protein
VAAQSESLWQLVESFETDETFGFSGEEESLKAGVSNFMIPTKSRKGDKIAARTFKGRKKERGSFIHLL